MRLRHAQSYSSSDARLGEGDTRCTARRVVLRGAAQHPRVAQPAVVNEEVGDEREPLLLKLSILRVRVEASAGLRRAHNLTLLHSGVLEQPKSTAEAGRVQPAAPCYRRLPRAARHLVHISCALYGLSWISRTTLECLS